MANEFEFKLPSGEKVFTGNIVPDTLPLSFANYPDSDLLPLDQIVEILSNPRRILSRKAYGDKWILNQGNRSSCCPYAVAGNLQRKRFKSGLGEMELAPEFTYALINGGHDGGAMLDDSMVSITEHGMPPRNMVPYQAYLLSEISIEARRVAKSHRAFECYQFPRESIEKYWHAMVSAVCRGEGVVLAVHVGDSFMQGRGGFDRGPGNHAVGADDGVINGTPRSVMDIQLDMFNSWGLSFGDRGRMLINPRHIEEPMRYHAMYAMRSVTSDPNADNPFVK